jgi:short-subunit dehydrogenase involved in D-alanine esterification of teichoic acids
MQLTNNTIFITGGISGMAAHLAEYPIPVA